MNKSKRNQTTAKVRLTKVRAASICRWRS